MATAPRTLLPHGPVAPDFHRKTKDDIDTMATAMAVRAPADVSKDEIWRKCVSLSKAQQRAKQEEAQLSEKIFDTGTMAVTSLAAGFLFTKFPTIEYIGPVPVQPVVGALSLLYGVFGSGFWAERAENVGVGLLAPWLFDKGSEFAL